MHNGQSRQRNRYFKIADRKEKKRKWNILEEDL
jgi:hypothetical protein